MVKISANAGAFFVTSFEYAYCANSILDVPEQELRPLKPAIYLFRHAIELYLKGIHLAAIGTDFSKEHELINLSKLIAENSDRFSFGQTVIDTIDGLIDGMFASFSKQNDDVEERFNEWFNKLDREEKQKVIMKPLFDMREIAEKYAAHLYLEGKHPDKRNLLLRYPENENFEKAIAAVESSDDVRRDIVSDIDKFLSTLFAIIYIFDPAFVDRSLN